MATTVHPCHFPKKTQIYAASRKSNPGSCQSTSISRQAIQTQSPIDISSPHTCQRGCFDWMLKQRVCFGCLSDARPVHGVAKGSLDICFALGCKALACDLAVQCSLKPSGAWSFIAFLGWDRSSRTRFSRKMQAWGRCLALRASLFGITKSSSPPPSGLMKPEQTA